MKLISKRLTYANVMSSIAVFLILGGATAFAAKKIGSNEIKGNSITTAKIKKNAVTASKIKKNSIRTAKISKGAVTNAKIAAGSVEATKLAPGFVAPTAEKLTHSANISVSGTVLAGSIGIAQANVTHTSTGFYCFSGLSPAPAGGVATVDYSEAGKDVTIQLDTGQPPGTLCPAGTQAFVDPREKAGEPVDAGFFVLLY
ncbi:MAG TPA: hypothetical protein VN758_14805 [Solirubrobacterales bacterium]|nr:hypothetical protein [Solirubrobacterales bacterium]